MAIAALVLAAIPCLCIWAVGGVLGLISYRRIKARPEELSGSGLAMAAMVLAGVWCGLAIIMSLASIAIPNFIKFQARSKQAEARSNLRSIETLQAEWHAQHGAYALDLAVLGFDPNQPGGAVRYTYYLGDGAPVGKADQYLPAGVSSVAFSDYYSAVAVGQIDADPALDVWGIDNTGRLENVQNDVQVE